MLGQVETSCGDKFCMQRSIPVQSVCIGIQRKCRSNRISSPGRTENALSGRGKHRRDGSTNSSLPLPESVRERRSLRHERGMCRRNGSIFRGSDVPARTSAVRLLGVCQTGEKCAAAAGRCSVFAKTDLIHRQQEGCAGGRCSARTFLCRDPQF